MINLLRKYGVWPLTALYMYPLLVIITDPIYYYDHIIIYSSVLSYGPIQKTTPVICTVDGRADGRIHILRIRELEPVSRIIYPVGIYLELRVFGRLDLCSGPKNVVHVLTRYMYGSKDAGKVTSVSQSVSMIRIISL